MSIDDDIARLAWEAGRQASRLAVSMISSNHNTIRMDAIRDCYEAIKLLHNPYTQNAPVDPRDPDHSRPAPFDYHNCWKCNSGRKPCVNSRPFGCEYLHARND